MEYIFTFESFKSNCSKTYLENWATSCFTPGSRHVLYAHNSDAQNLDFCVYENREINATNRENAPREAKQ